MLAAILCFDNLKVKVTKYKMLSDAFEICTHKFCKNKRIQNYAQKLREKNHVQTPEIRSKINVFERASKFQCKTTTEKNISS